MTKKKIPSARRYFVKDEDGVFVVKEPFFADIENRDEALFLALMSWFELQEQLTDDAMAGAAAFIGNMKVTTGLERTLARIEEKYPGTLANLRSIERRRNGHRIYTC